MSLVDFEARVPAEMESPCPSCGATVLDIDVRCKACGASLGSTGAQRLIGQVVLGQYELLDVLGHGGMSVVYQGRHRITDQPVALKILPPELAAHSQVKSRFLEEAKALAQLDHPNIVHLYNFGQENGSFVLAMQFVAGKTWERLILENQRLSWQVTARITIDVLRALEYAHGQGIIHRDMKPSNVLVRASDSAATVMDFGIAKMTTSSRLTATGQTMGTVRYMSPEQVRGQEVDASTDLYSLGATMYESLVGETPFDGSTHFDIMSKHLTDVPVPPSKRGVSVPANFEQALMRSLSKKPSERPGSARELRKLLEAELREQDVGLVETQKVSRELLREAVARPQVAAVTAPGTVTNFAMQDVDPPAKRGRTGRWIGLVLLASAGLAAAAFAITRGRAAAPATMWVPTGVALAPRVEFPELGLAVRAPEAINPAEVAHAYKEAREAFDAHLRSGGLQILATPPVHEIVVVPPATLCLPSTYSGIPLPKECMTAVHAFRVADHTLVVVDDPESWPRAMSLGVSEAVCTIQGEACDLALKFPGAQ
ncbi:MAG: serine/threonine-protein kinase [Kofleriaceae bacterium]